MLNIRPKDLLALGGKAAPLDRRLARRPGTCRPVPPSWRTCRLRMSRAHFLAIVGAWIGGLALLVAVVLTVRWS